MHNARDVRFATLDLRLGNLGDSRGHLALADLVLIQAVEARLVGEEVLVDEGIRIGERCRVGFGLDLGFVAGRPPSEIEVVVDLEDTLTGKVHVDIGILVRDLNSVLEGATRVELVQNCVIEIAVVESGLTDELRLHLKQRSDVSISWVVGQAITSVLLRLSSNWVFSADLFDPKDGAVLKHFEDNRQVGCLGLHVLDPSFVLVNLEVAAAVEILFIRDLDNGSDRGHALEFNPPVHTAIALIKFHHRTTALIPARQVKDLRVSRVSRDEGWVLAPNQVGTCLRCRKFIELVAPVDLWTLLTSGQHTDQLNFRIHQEGLIDVLLAIKRVFLVVVDCTVRHNSRHVALCKLGVLQREELKNGAVFAVDINHNRL